MTLVVNNIHFGYQNNRLLKSLNFSINKGEIISIVGKSGCGKTSLLNLIAGYKLPQEGYITNPFRIGYIYQTSSLFPWLTIEENINLCFKSAYVDHKLTNEMHFNRLSKLMNINSVMKLYPTQISGGENQRAVLMQMLLLDKEIILMDEPFASLDAITRTEMDLLLLQIIHQQHIGIVLVTHNVDEAILVSNKIVVLYDNDNKKNILFELGKIPQNHPEERLYVSKFIKIKKQIMQLLNI